MRRLDDVSKRFEETVREVREFRSWAERLYVPRGEWVEGRRADQGFIKDVAKDVGELQDKAKTDASWRRTILAGVLVSTFSAVISAAITFAVVILGKG
jgi:hypothetical protein